MGCTASKDQVSKPGKGQKGRKGAKPKGAKAAKITKSGSKKQTDDSEADSDEEQVVIIDAKPEMLRKDIAKAYKAMVEKRDRLRPQMRPFLGERRGLNALLEEERQKLMTLLETKTGLEEEKAVLLTQLWEKDVEEIKKAYDLYESKFGETVSARLISEGSSLLGRSNLSKLMQFRMQPQPQRDAQLIREFTKGLSVQDECLLEVLLTRSNAELKAALDYFTDEYGSTLSTVLSGHSYKNYREFLNKVFECQRDEKEEPFDTATARQLADELYQSGAGRSIGIVAEPFIRVLSNISIAQFESLNEVYKGKQLLKDIDAKLGGDFAVAVKIRCTDKYVYLASRLSLAFKSFSVDKDVICRILGCVSRWECVKIREAYDKADYGRTLEAALKVACSSEPNFLRALTLLINGDLSLTPLCSDKELGEDERDIAKAGNRARVVAVEQYDKQAVFEKGDKLRRAGGAEAADDDVPNFDMDERCRTSDVTVLSAALKEIEDVKSQLDTFKETVKDEVVAIKESYFAINSHCYETENWIGLLRAHVRSLKAYAVSRSNEVVLKPALVKSYSSFARR